ncbi:MAG TPA: helix-turn-helix domain-containing protein [Ktedonobacterales bacterium]
MVSVSHVLSQLLPPTARLLGGAEGVQRQVSWAATMRTRPPAFESLQGGELALLSLSALSALQEVDSSLTLAKVVRSLDEANVAAVAVAGLDEQRLSSEEQQAVALADERALPLIALPRQPTLMDIERDVIAFVVQQRGGAEQQADDLYQELLALSLRRAGIGAMLTRLATSLQKIVLLEDDSARLLDSAAPLDMQPLVQMKLEPALAAHPARTLFPNEWKMQADSSAQRGLPVLIEQQALDALGLARLVTPIRLSQQTAGYLSFAAEGQRFEPVDRLALGQVAPLIALELARVQELAEMEQRLHGDVLDEVLAGAGDYAPALARARQLGHDLSVPSMVLKVRAERSGSIPEGYESADTQEAPPWMRRAVAEVERLFPAVWARMRADDLVLLIPVEEGLAQELWNARFKSRLDELLARLCLWQDNESLRVGVGRMASGIQELAPRYREARQALMIGRRLFAAQQITYFGELGIYRLLFHLHGSEDARAFYDEVLGALIEYDHRTNNELVETLEAYFACNGNLSEAARRLHLHRNSLLYRLERIQEVLHADLEDADTRLALQVALKMRHTLT